MKALAPARVREVRIHPDTGTAEVIVPDFQLSLAIGKEGQNARLAARLTGWRVDIKSETQLQEEESGGGVEYAEGEWVTNESGELVWQPAEGGDAISAAEAGYAAPAPEAGPAADEAAAPAGAAAAGAVATEVRVDAPAGATAPEAAATDAEPAADVPTGAPGGAAEGADEGGTDGHAPSATEEADG
jgi:N utilization substance protein A